MARTYATPAAIILISVLFPILGLIAVFLRFYTRIKANGRLWVDDWLTIPALILEFVLAGLLIWGAATKSLGDVFPQPDIPGPEGFLFSESRRQIRTQHIQYFFDFIGVFEFGLLKLSILFFYRKIFCTAALKTSTFDIVTRVMICLVILWTLAFGISAILVCGAHPEFAWTAVANLVRKCGAQLPVLEAYAISDFVMDVLIWSLPLPKIWGLHMSTSAKFAVMGVFLVGFLTIAASAARMAIYIKFVVNAFHQPDGETLITYLLFWTMIECGLGVVVVCLPTLRSLYGNLFPGSIVRGIRSILGSGSQAVRESKPGVHRLGSIERSSDPYKSFSNAHGPYEGTIQTYVVGSHDLEGQKHLPKTGIQIKNQVEQYSWDSV